MAPTHPHGVLDHTVTLPRGAIVLNAFRVTPRGSGSLLTFVVLRASWIGPASEFRPLDDASRLA